VPPGAVAPTGELKFFPRPHGGGVSTPNKFFLGKKQLVVGGNGAGGGGGLDPRGAGPRTQF